MSTEYEIQEILQRRLNQDNRVTDKTIKCCNHHNFINFFHLGWVLREMEELELRRFDLGARTALVAELRMQRSDQRIQEVERISQK